MNSQRVHAIRNYLTNYLRKALHQRRNVYDWETDAVRRIPKKCRCTWSNNGSAHGWKLELVHTGCRVHGWIRGYVCVKCLEQQDYLLIDLGMLCIDCRIEEDHRTHNQETELGCPLCPAPSAGQVE